MPKRVFKCRLCQNHGILTPLRGHKYKCPYLSCSCIKCKTTQRRKEALNHSRVSRTNGYQRNGCKRKIDDVESDEDLRVIAWINGEEVQEGTAEARASEQAQSKDELCISPLQQTVTSQATSEARTQILKQIKDLHDLRQCGALSTKEFDDAKAIVLTDFK